MTMWQREGVFTISPNSPRNYHITKLKRVANGEHVLKELHRGNIYYFTLTTCPGIKSTLYKSHRVRALQDIRKKGHHKLKPTVKTQSSCTRFTNMDISNIYQTVHKL